MYCPKCGKQDDFIDCTPVKKDEFKAPQTYICNSCKCMFMVFKKHLILRETDLHIINGDQIEH